MALDFLEFCSLWRSQCLLASGKAMLKTSLKAATSSLTSAPEEGDVMWLMVEVDLGLTTEQVDLVNNGYVRLMTLWI